MTADLIDSHCRTLPGAEAERPFGPDTQVWKIGGKMFAAYGDGGHGVTVKCVDRPTALMLIEMGRAETAPYLKRGAWALFAWDSTSPEELRERVSDSYRAVRASLTRAVRDALPAFED